MKLTNKEYDALPGIRRSDLWKINKTPLHFKWAMEHKEDTEDKPKALLFGSAVHKYVLEREDFEKEYAVVPKFDRRTKQGKADYEAFIQDHEGLEFIDEEDFQKIQGMAQAIESNPEAIMWLTGDHEEAFQWLDIHTGEACKVKTDVITEHNGKPYIVDYKTTDSCEDGHFERSCRKYGYDFQAGMYVEGVGYNTLEEYGFVFVAQEKTEPYAVRVYYATEEFIEQGKTKFHNLLQKYHNRKETDTWEGYESVELWGDNYE